MKKIEIINDDKGSNIVAYASYELPWPISNRDIIINTKIKMQHGDQQTVTLDITSTEHSDFPPKDKNIRIKKYNCVAHLEVISKDQTRLTYTIKADPGGNIPPIAVNLITKESQYLTLKNLKKLARQKNNIRIDKNIETDGIMKASIK